MIPIQGLYDYATESGKKHIITTSIEHKAVLETVKAMERRGFEIDIVNPDESGRVSAEAILNLVRDDTLLVSVMHVNNETGIIQPVIEIGNALAERGVLFHVDATQSCGKLVDEIRELKYDMLSFSAHKFQGPQGIGALILRKKRYKLPPIKPIMYGGQQEKGISPGTIPVALVAGLGKACELAMNSYKENAEHSRKIKEMIVKQFEESGLEFHLNGDKEYCVNTTINIALKGVSSEALMIASKQYCGISNGSACTSQSYSLSYVLKAMGLDEERIENSIRISWGNNSDIDDIKIGINNLISIAKEFVI